MPTSTTSLELEPNRSCADTRVCFLYADIAFSLFFPDSRTSSSSPS